MKGKSHIEIWSKSDEFDISEIETVENERDDFKILMLTDTQFWSNPKKNKEFYDEMDKLVEETEPDMFALPGYILSAMASRFIPFICLITADI